MENHEIRKRAFQLYLNNWKLLLTVSLAIQGLGFAARFLINSLPINLPFTSQVTYFILTVLLYPLILGGMLVMFQLWNEQRGNRPSVFTIFTYYRNGKSFASAMLVGLVLLLLKQLVSVVYSAIITVANQSSIIMSLVLLLAAVVVYFVLTIWLNGELFLYPYLYLNENDDSPIRLLKESFRRMMGNVRSWIEFWFGLGWWAFVIFLVMTAVLRGFNAQIASSFGTGIGAAGAQMGMSFLSSIVFLVFFWLIEPYWGLACVGFAKDLLPPAGKAKTKAIPQKADKSSENR